MVDRPLEGKAMTFAEAAALDPDDNPGELEAGT